MSCGCLLPPPFSRRSRSGRRLLAHLPLGLSAGGLFLLLALTACGSLQPSSWVYSPPVVDKVTVDRITYVNSAGDIFTIKGDGTSRQRLTGGTRTDAGPTGSFMAQSLDFSSFHAWPTWSPNGEQLAVSRVRVSQGSGAEISIQVMDAATGVSDTVYDSGFPGLVADGSPHYLYWSPDNQTLSFLASTSGGLGLFVLDTRSGGAPVMLERGAPLYYSWSGEGASLLVHIGEDIKLYRELSDHGASDLLASSTGFRVPAFSPDGQWVAYVNTTSEGNALFVAEVTNLGQPRRIAAVRDFSAFMWSPTGAELAVGDQASPTSGAFERLRIVSASGGGEEELTGQSLLAFYWAPDGRRIAWVGIDREDRNFHWNVSSVSPNTAPDSPELFSFHPTREVLTMLSYFDQYAYSHSPWSPDSAHLVVAGSEVPPFERRNGHTPTGARVYVIDVTGQAPPQEIAEGTLAFWSWN